MTATGAASDMSSPSITDLIFGVYLPPIIAPIGITSNILTLLALSQRQYCNNPSCIYLKFQALWSLGNGIIFFEFYLVTFFQVSMPVVGDVFCKQANFFGYLLSNLQSWTVVFMTFARFIAVAFPFRAAGICTKNAVHYFQLGISLTFTAWSLPQAVLQRIPDDDSSARLGCSFNVSPFVAWLYEILHVFSSVVVPFIFVLILNIYIVYTLRKEEANRGAIAGTCSTKAVDSKTVTTLVLLVTGSFLCCSLPYVIHVTVWDVVFYIKSVSVEQYGMYMLSHQIAMSAFAVYDNTGFFLYFIACKRFRRDFTKAFCACCSNRDRTTR